MSVAPQSIALTVVNKGKAGAIGALATRRAGQQKAQDSGKAGCLLLRCQQLWYHREYHHACKRRGEAGVMAGAAGAKAGAGRAAASPECE